jgi:hypothetical protein
MLRLAARVAQRGAAPRLSGGGAAAAPLRAFCAAAEGPPEKTPEEITAVMEASKKKVAQTITPWIARPENSPAEVQTATANPAEMSMMTGHSNPADCQDRKVRIFNTPKCAMQEGTHTSKAWELRFLNRERWVNPLMGWASTADPHSNTHLHFESADQAVRFAERNGWDYAVEDTAERADMHGTKAYSQNFLAPNVENRLKQGAAKARAQFQHPTNRQSVFTKTLKYHGDGEVLQHGGDVSKPTYNDAAKADRTWARDQPKPQKKRSLVSAQAYSKH